MQALTLAPQSNNSLTNLTWPPWAATNKGVPPSFENIKNKNLKFNPFQ